MTTAVPGLGQEADEAAGRGDLARARLLLERVVADHPQDLASHLKLAAICRALGEPQAALAATEAALAVEPLHFTALLLRANLLEAIGSAETDEAYGRALAQRPLGETAPQIERMIGHAELRYAEYQKRENTRLADAVERASLNASPVERARLARFRTNAVRTTRVYRSAPSDFHYPGLVEREFHDREGFSWIEELEAATDIIADELATLMAAERRELVPYVQYHERQPLRQWKQLNNSYDWSALHLLLSGQRVEANARHCPQTMTLLSALPLPYIDGISPNAMFSLLAPGAHIPPHTGVANTRLVCHLPLIVPGRCWFRVGADRRDWRRGIAWVFDDTIEHEAANESASLRVVLIVDIWHPGLSAVERAGVAALIAEHGRRAADGV